MHDTYFVVSKAQLIITTALLFAFFAIVTWGIEKMSRRLNSMLNWIHCGLTMICFTSIGVLGSKLLNQSAPYKDYSVLDEIEEYESMMSIYEWLAIIVVILILSQLLFLINIIRAFIVKKKS